MTEAALPATTTRASPRLRRRIERTLLYLVLVVGSLVYLFPLYWTLRTSLLPEGMVLAEPPVWIPWPPQWVNYATMWEAGPFPSWIQNSVAVTSVGVIALTVSSTVAAFGFARTDFPGRERLFLVVLATLMMPYHVQLVPQYVLFNWFGMIDTLWPLIIPSFFGSAFYIFVLRQFLLTIPRELDEAAEIDGATRLQIMAYVVVPLAKPAIATVAAFAFIDLWNDFVRPVVYLQRTENLTLAVGIRWFRNQYGSDFHHLMAGSMIILLPMILVFFLAQKHFVRGIALTGIRG